MKIQIIPKNRNVSGTSAMIVRAINCQTCRNDRNFSLVSMKLVIGAVVGTSFSLRSTGHVRLLKRHVDCIACGRIMLKNMTRKDNLFHGVRSSCLFYVQVVQLG